MAARVRSACRTISACSSSSVIQGCSTSQISLAPLPLRFLGAGGEGGSGGSSTRYWERSKGMYGLSPRSRG